MPYKLSEDGKAVMVKRRGKRWTILKRHLTRAKASAHLRALYANVRE